MNLDETDDAQNAAPEAGFAGANYDLLATVPVRLSVEAGSTSLALSTLLSLSEGSVVELNRQTGDLLDIMVNGALVARGEIVTVDGRYGIRVAEVARASQRLGPVERR